MQEDQLAAVERASQRRGAAQIDLSLLTDGLEAEREQGITIDVAYRYFATPRRKFIIADAPGHEQYTRNMATGASNADALVLLLDVTRRPEAADQAAPADRPAARHPAGRRVRQQDGPGRLVARGVRRRRDRTSRPSPRRSGSRALDIIPGSALRGDMVVERGESLGWYRGPTLLERLETLHAGAESAAAGPFRFPVQLVSRPQRRARRAATWAASSPAICSPAPKWWCCPRAGARACGRS